jgi:hypothetical protein
MAKTTTDAEVLYSMMSIRGSISPAGDRSQRDTFHGREVSNLTSADNTEDV